MTWWIDLVAYLGAFSFGCVCGAAVMWFVIAEAME